ncbi:MAG TPA: hypothetical protein VFK31_04200 [Rhodanobacteraceae bacterium]|nr:hypothetical protein [Rhodanobacteraceae bacterium]
MQTTLRPLAVWVAAACLSVPAFAADPTTVPAGTSISNTAAVTYTMDGKAHTLSAHATFVVDQLLDVAATWQNGTPVEAPAGSTQRSLLFKVTNTGNGSDSYALTLHASPDPQNGFTADHCQLYLDNDHDGAFSHGDTLYPAPANAPALAANASLDVLAVCHIPDNAGDKSLSDIELQVASTTLTGQPGDTKPVTGHGGYIAVVGMSGNEARAVGAYAASNVTYTFTSSQRVTDKSGGHVVTSGSRITYTLIVTPQGTATGRHLVVNTPIPNHTTYVPGSLTLDGNLLGDSESDGDAGDYDASAHAVIVRLGDLSGASAAQHIRFQVTIN